MPNVYSKFQHLCTNAGSKFARLKQNPSTIKVLHRTRKKIGARHVFDIQVLEDDFPRDVAIAFCDTIRSKLAIRSGASTVVINGGSPIHLQNVLYAANFSCDGPETRAYKEPVSNIPIIEALHDRNAAIKLGNEVYVAQVNAYINKRIHGTLSREEIVQLRAKNIYAEYRPSFPDIPPEELIIYVAILTANHESQRLSAVARYVAQVVWSEMPMSIEELKKPRPRTEMYGAVRAVNEKFGGLVDDHIERIREFAGN